MQFPVEFALRTGAQEAHDQARGGEEPHRHAPAACLAAQRDGEMGLAGAGRGEHDHVLRPVEESEVLESAPLPVRRHAHVLPIVAVEFPGGREPRLPEQARASGRLPGFDLRVHPPVHELHLGRGRGSEPFGEHLPGQRRLAGRLHDPVHLPVRGSAPAGGVGPDRASSAHVHAAFARGSGLMNRSYAYRSGAGTPSGARTLLMRQAGLVDHAAPFDDAPAGPAA